MEDVIKFLQDLVNEKPDKKYLIDRAIEACAAYDPKCHYCKYHETTEWFSGCNHPNHTEYDGCFGYFCEDFEPK